jgi:hypothetical protein
MQTLYFNASIAAVIHINIASVEPWRPYHSEHRNTLVPAQRTSPLITAAKIFDSVD